MENIPEYWFISCNRRVVIRREQFSECDWWVSLAPAKIDASSLMNSWLTLTESVVNASKCDFSRCCCCYIENRNMAPFYKISINYTVVCITLIFIEKQFYWIARQWMNASLACWCYMNNLSRWGGGGDNDRWCETSVCPQSDYQKYGSFCFCHKPIAADCFKTKNVSDSKCSGVIKK